MPGPHPMALRERVVKAYNDGEGSFREIGERFDVGEASVNRWVALERRTGGLDHKQLGSRRPSCITPEAVAYMLSLLEDEPIWTTTELAEELEDVFGIKVSRQRVSIMLKRAGFTHKKGLSGHWPRSAPE